MNWYPIWSYHFQNYESLPAESAGMNQIIHFFSPLETKAVRILFSNSQGEDPVLFDQAGIRTDREEKSLQFDGQSRLLLAPGEERWSDPVRIRIPAGEAFVLSAWVEGKITSYAGLNNDSVFRVSFSDHRGEEIRPEQISRAAERKFNPYVYFGVRTIEVLTEDRAEIITAFGDSLVQQGHWFQEWYKLLLQKGKRSVLLNEGISGNRVLRDASSSSRLNSIFGEAGIKRIRKDVFGRYQPDQVILAEGINDLGHPGDGCSLEELPCAKELIEGIKELGCLVRREGSCPVFVTLSPFCDYDGIWSEEREAIRQEVNSWIRQQESVMDADAFVRDAGRRERLQEQYDSGDHLHLNRAGGCRIAGKWEERR